MTLKRWDFGPLALQAGSSFQPEVGLCGKGRKAHCHHASLKEPGAEERQARARLGAAWGHAGQRGPCTPHLPKVAASRPGLGLLCLHCAWRSPSKGRQGLSLCHAIGQLQHEKQHSPTRCPPSPSPNRLLLIQSSCPKASKRPVYPPMLNQGTLAGVYTDGKLGKGLYSITMMTCSSI